MGITSKSSNSSSTLKFSLTDLELDNAKIALDRRRTLSAAFTYFIVAGIATVMLGPILPVLGSQWNVPDAQLGNLFVAMFLGQLTGAWLAVRRLNVSLALGAVATALGSAGLAYTGFAGAHVALFFVGMGLGAGLTAGNVLVGTVRLDDISAPKAGRASSHSKLIAILNMCWGIGAIASPLLIHASLRLGHRSSTQIDGLRFFFLLLAAALLCSAVLTLVLLSRVQRFSHDESRREQNLPFRTFAFFLANMLLYVGIENALGGWLPTHAHRTLKLGLGADVASSIALCFWIGELGGRGLTTLLLNRISERVLYRASITLLLAAMGAICFVHHLTTFGLFTLVIIAAVSLAPLYPLVVSFLVARAGRQPRLGPLFALSALGGAFLPWLTGAVSTHFHALRVGLAVPATGALLLLLLSAGLRRNSDSEPTLSP